MNMLRSVYMRQQKKFYDIKISIRKDILNGGQRSLKRKFKLRRLYQNWLQMQDKENRKQYTRMNREVKRDVTKCKTDTWERKRAQLDCYMGDTKIAEAQKL